MLSLFVIIDAISARSLRSKLAELQKCRKNAAEGFDFGSLLHVRGNVTTYGGQREVKASQFGESLLIRHVSITATVLHVVTVISTIIIVIVINNVIFVVVFLMQFWSLSDSFLVQQYSKHVQIGMSSRMVVVKGTFQNRF